MSVQVPAEGCVPITGTGAGSALIPVQVTWDSMAKEWLVDTNPIVLDNPNVKVVWNLKEVFSYPWGSPVTDVKIEFTKGPTGYNLTLGPFGSITPDLFPIPPAPPTLTGETQKPPPGPCYCYNLVVSLGGHGISLFPVDPQIDNLAPPGDGDGHGGES